MRRESDGTQLPSQPVVYEMIAQTGAFEPHRFPLSRRLCPVRLVETVLQAKSSGQQFMLWNIHRREFKLLTCAHLCQQFQMRSHYPFADPKI